jgi:hypothetical protein
LVDFELVLVRGRRVCVHSGYVIEEGKRRSVGRLDCWGLMIWV